MSGDKKENFDDYNSDEYKRNNRGTPYDDYNRRRKEKSYEYEDEGDD